MFGKGGQLFHLLNVSIFSRSGQAKLLAIAVDCLRILSIKHQASKDVILECEGPNILVTILREQNYKNLLVMTARLLKGTKSANIHAILNYLQMTLTLCSPVRVPEEQAGHRPRRRH